MFKLLEWVVLLSFQLIYCCVLWTVWLIQVMAWAVTSGVEHAQAKREEKALARRYPHSLECLQAALRLPAMPLSQLRQGMTRLEAELGPGKITGWYIAREGAVVRLYPDGHFGCPRGDIWIQGSQRGWFPYLICADSCGTYAHITICTENMAQADFDAIASRMA